MAEFRARYSSEKPLLDFPRPDLFDEVEWASHVSAEDAAIAYRFWHLPDEALKLSMKDRKHNHLDSVSEEDRRSAGIHNLARTVYEHMINAPEVRVNSLPGDDWEPRWNSSGLAEVTWKYQDVFGYRDETDTNVVIPGHGHKLSNTYWNQAKLREELEKRGLDTTGKVAELKQRLGHDELHQHRALPRSDLSRWDINRDEPAQKHAIVMSENRSIGALSMYTCAILISPYNPVYWLGRAYCHYLLGFYDLAIGDAYRAQLLSEVLANPFRRNLQPKLYTLIWHAIEQHILVDKFRPPNYTEPTDTLRQLRQGNGVNYFMPTIRKALHTIISFSLILTQSWREYYKMENYLRQRLIMHHRDSGPFENRQKRISVGVPHSTTHNPNFLHYTEKAGSVPGDRPYPFDAEDKDRYSKAFVDKLNKRYFESIPKQLCEIRVKKDTGNDKSLGIFAKTDIEEGQRILLERPSLRGQLGLIRGQHRPSNAYAKCETCAKPITTMLLERYEDQARYFHPNHPDYCSCVNNSVPVYYCPSEQAEKGRPGCADIARRDYHFRACGKNWVWINSYMDVHSRGTRPKFRTEEAPTAAMLLLLREVLDITLERRKNDPDLLAHEIDELLTLEGPDDWTSQSFPFTMDMNIQAPLDILMQLGVDIFRDLSFDIWVIQMVIKKLMTSVVPADINRREGRRPPAPEFPSKEEHAKGKQKQREDAEEEPKPDNHDNRIRDLYLYSSYSFFNNACWDRNNAMWGYGDIVRNRVNVWVTEYVEKDEEICFPYVGMEDVSSDHMTRVLGKECYCGGDHTNPPLPRSSSRKG